MNRYYYVCQNLDDISRAQEQLLAAGFEPVQLYTLSYEDAEVEKRALNDVNSLSKTDIVSSTIVGLALGVAGAAAILILAALIGVSSQVAWVPIVFLAICVLGFCTWEGGFLGIQTTNRQFKRFEPELRAGKHIFFADLHAAQKETFFRIVSSYPTMKNAGRRRNKFAWLMPVRAGARKFVRWAP